MNELHLFSGIGGGILGGMLLGHTCVCAVEIEPYCRKVLLQRQRDGILQRFPIWDDIKTFDGKPWRGKVDIIAGGFPCQDISMGANSAGGGIGIKGERSGLWSEMARIIGEIQPGKVFVENSPMLLFRGMQRIIGDMARMGYDCKWGVFRACYVGCLHERARLFIYADNNKIKHSGNRAATDKKIPYRIHRKNGKDWQQSWGELAALGIVEPSHSYSESRRIFYGFPNAMDRYSAIGNAQVPAVVKLAWETLSQ